MQPSASRLTFSPVLPSLTDSTSSSSLVWPMRSRMARVSRRCRVVTFAAVAVGVIVEHELWQEGLVLTAGELGHVIALEGRLRAPWDCGRGLDAVAPREQDHPDERIHDDRGEPAREK